MDDLAIGTWSDLRIGTRLKLAPGEESITDHNLLELHRSVSGFNVQKFSKSAEKLNGADWEWWIGSDATRWIRLRVQAKRIHHRTYKMLSHKDKRTGEMQMDTLIQSSQSEVGVYPYHVFYNGWDMDRFKGSDVTDALKKNPLFRTCCRTEELWGCAAVPSELVRGIYQTPHGTYAPRYLEHAVPWSHLFGFPASVRGSEEQLSAIEKQLEAERIRAFELLSNFDIQDQGSPGRVTNVPGYARMVMRGNVDESQLDTGTGLPPAKVIITTNLEELGQSG